MDFLIEDDFSYYLNNKRVDELNPTLFKLIQSLFGKTYPNELIKCEIIDGFCKPDIIITYNGIKKYVSLKTGNAEAVHQEEIQKVIAYFRKEGISERTIETILLFHFGDGTTDGTGRVREGYEALMYKLKERISEANKELNASKEFVLKCIYRFVFAGVRNDYPVADIVYHGTTQYGCWFSFMDATQFIQTRNYRFVHNLHIGPMMIRPHARYVNKPIRHQKSREKANIYWHNFANDISKMSFRYNN